MQIGLIGRGAIAGYVSAAIADRADWHLAAQITRTPQEGAVTSVADLSPLDVLVDCAGHGGLMEHGVAALSEGIPLITLSLGALADAAVMDRLRDAARAGNTQLRLASGAIGALDTLRAARAGGLSTVRYTGCKPPAGWRGSPAEAALDLDTLTTAQRHFDGTASDAALRYPKNANVAAAVALSGLGFDATQVTLIADPAAPGNTHRVEAAGTFGHFTFEVTGAGLPDNPRSSALAAMSALSALEAEGAPLRFA